MSPEVRCENGSTCDGVLDLGIVIKYTDTNQLHVGILYKWGDHAAKVCHLAWHKRLMIEVPKTSNVWEPESSFVWLQSGLDDTSRELVAASVVGIGLRNTNTIAYSTNYHGKYFDERSFRFNRDQPGDGLTCATFILALFRQLGIELLKCSEWLPRPSDTEWSTNIVSFLKGWGERELALGRGDPTLPEHVAAIQNSPTAPRFRPEEVAAGIWSRTRPLDFQSALNIACNILPQVPEYVPDTQ
jgi:hypothetical protein